MMRSSEARFGARLVLGLGLALASLATARAVLAASLCQADESVAFSCATGSKLASLCASRKGDTLDALVYRFGAPGRIEKEFRASQDNQNRFSGFVSPANPRASVREIWFEQGPFTYLLTQCVGGDCAHPAGIAVLRDGKLKLNAYCAFDPKNDTAWFAPELVEFGSDLQDSKSKTNLLKLEEADHPIYKIYKPSRVY